METTQVKAEFNLISEKLSVNEMVCLLGFAGDSSGDKNDLLKNGRLRGNSFIELCTEYEDSFDIYDQYNKLLERVIKLKKNIIEALKTGEIWCHFCIVVKIENGTTPAMTLNREFISLLHELKAEIEFDTYANPYKAEIE